MTNPAQAIALGKQLQHSGHLVEAEQLYLLALDRAPAEPEGLHLLGLLHAETGRAETAVQLLSAAIGIQGPQPHLCRNLGILLEQNGDTQGALACYRQALAADGSDTELWEKVARLLTVLSRYGEAAAAWKRTIESVLPGDSREAEWHLNTGKVLALSGDILSAAESFRRSVNCNPHLVEAQFNRGAALMQLNRRDDAQEAFRVTLRLDAQHAPAHNNLAILLHAAGRRSEARQHYERSLHSDPAFLAPRYNLGTLLQETGETDAAAAEFEAVLAADPHYAAAWTNLGNCLLSRNRISQAISCYDRALALRPRDASALWNRGIAQLTTGNLLEGWTGYEERFAVRRSALDRAFPVPVWKGESLAGKRILVHAEQGLGDTLQFCRYIPMLAAAGAKVYFECQPALLPLLGSLAGGAVLIPRRPSRGAASVEDLPETDFHIPLLSLPAVFVTSLDTIPAVSSYLQSAAERRTHWHQRLAPLKEKLRCGIVWQGNPKHRNDHLRSIPAEALRPLSRMPGVALVSLQYRCAAPDGLAALDLGHELGEFDDTAALIQSLDLVISVDTSIAHLAGALGQRIWTLLAYAPDWRWMLERGDSPWYPTMRLFRQPGPGDWPGTVANVAAALAEQTKSCVS